MDFLLYWQKVIYDKHSYGDFLILPGWAVLCLADVRGGAAFGKPPSYRQGWNAEL